MASSPADISLPNAPTTRVAPASRAALIAALTCGPGNPGTNGSTVKSAISVMALSTAQRSPGMRACRGNGVANHVVT